jgi:hypothetical protein
MGDSRKKFDDNFKFWEEQDVVHNEKKHNLTPRQAVSIIDRALLQVSDMELGEDLETLKEWIKNK